MKVWKVMGQATFTQAVSEVVCAKTEEEAEQLAQAQYIKEHKLKLNHCTKDWDHVVVTKREARDIPLWGLVIWQINFEDCDESHTEIFFAKSREACVSHALKLLNEWVGRHERHDSTGASTGVQCPFESSNTRSAMEILADVGTVDAFLSEQDLNSDRMTYFPGSGWDYSHYGFRLAPAFEDATWGHVAEH